MVSLRFVLSRVCVFLYSLGPRSSPKKFISWNTTVGSMMWRPSLVSPPIETLPIAFRPRIFCHWLHVSLCTWYYNIYILYSPSKCPCATQALWQEYFVSPVLLPGWMELHLVSKKYMQGCFYKMQYPVRWTAQSALDLTLWQTCSFRHRLDFFGKHSSRAARAETIHSYFHHCLWSVSIWFDRHLKKCFLDCP